MSPRPLRCACRAYEEAMKGVRNLMLMRTDHDGLLFVAELSNGGKSPKMDHLVCFLPGAPGCPCATANCWLSP